MIIQTILMTVQVEEVEVDIFLAVEEGVVRTVVVLMAVLEERRQL